MKPFPNDKRGQAHHSHNEKGYDESRSEPIVLLAFVKHRLQRADTNGEQANADVVEALNCHRTALRPRWILNQSIKQKQGQNSHRHIDKEDPAPGVVVGDPAPQSRANRRSNYSDNSKEGEREAALL